ncbi:hypothetical protein ACP4OV_017313 [Aristida adscensionis]
MEMLCNALLSELVGRSISFLVSTYATRPPAAVLKEEHHLHRLRLLLLRAATVVEEADGRHVADRGALRRQLAALRDEMFSGHYVLDTYVCRQAGRQRRRPVAGGHNDGASGRRDEDEVRRRGWSSSSNPAKRARRQLRLSGDDDDDDDPETTVAAKSPRELRRAVRRLKAIAGDTKELVVFLTTCPPLRRRQPYSAHLSMDRCMFGRHAEKDRVMEFLLQLEPLGAANYPGVLPIVGPALIGKSTLVEHVCNDERVRDHFSMIMFYSGDDLDNETFSLSFRDNCVIKHQARNASGDERWLLGIELAGDIDDIAWKRLYSWGRSMPRGSKLIVTSRSDKIARLGTTLPLRLKPLTREAFWYFFKVLVFGSTDPEESPELAAMAMAMALEFGGSFMHACIGAAMLRCDFRARFWRTVQGRLRWYTQKNRIVFGEYPDELEAMDRPRYVLSMVSRVPDDECFVLYEMRQRSAAREDDGDLPEVTMVDLMTGRARPRTPGRFEVLYWQSAVPPYFNYVRQCEIGEM